MILDLIKEKMFQYQKEKNLPKLEVYRYFMSLVQNKEIELRGTSESLNDTVVFGIIRKQIKNRNETIDIYQKANREDKVAAEKAELEIWLELAALFPFDLNLNSRPQQA